MKTQRDNAAFYIFNRSSLKSIITTIRTKKKKKSQNTHTHKKETKQKKKKNGGLFFSVKVFVWFFLDFFLFFSTEDEAPQCMVVVLATAMASWISRMTRMRVSICPICSLLIGWTEYQIGLLGATTGSGVR